MKLLGILLFSGALLLPAGDIRILRPGLQLLGRRVRTVKDAGVNGERVTELGYVCTFILRNTGGQTVKLATGFNAVVFRPEPGKNLFVLSLSHRMISVKVRKEEAPFPLILPGESFRLVTLRPGEGTLLTVNCWIREDKLRPGDRFVIEYAPRNFRRYDFLEVKLRSEPLELKIPAPGKKVTPVAI